MKPIWIQTLVMPSLYVTSSAGSNVAASVGQDNWQTRLDLVPRIS
jgi:hypothetical protein